MSHYRFLRKVVNVVKNADGTVSIETSEATLQEAIAGSDLKKEDLKITSFKVPVDVYMVPQAGQTQPKIDPYTKKGRMTPQWDIGIISSGENWCKPVTKPIVGDATVKVSPCIKARIWASVDVDIGWWWIFPYLAGFGMKMNGAASAGIDANVNALSFERELKLELPTGMKVDIYSWSAPPVTVWLGPIPIVLTPQVSLGVEFGKITLSAKATATGTISTSLTKFNLALGSDSSPMQYGFYCGNTVSAAGNWGCRGINNIPEKIEALKTQLRDWKPLSNPVSVQSSSALTFGIDYDARAKIAGSLALYGVLGLSGSVEPYVKPSVGVSIVPRNNGVRADLAASITTGLDGKIEGFVNLLFINETFTIAKFENLVPPAEFKYTSCWDSVYQVSC